MTMRHRLFLFSGGALALTLFGYAGAGVGLSAAAEKAMKLPPPAIDVPANPTAARATAVFAGGCFWGVQAVFQHTQGVLNAVSGYAGGEASTASYRKIGSGRTGHAESVQITYDPRVVSYGKLLQIFFSVAHDPTTLNRQGPDSGTQYRSAIFYQDSAQKELLEKYLVQINAAKVFPNKVVTELTPLTGFYPAEAYHQNYAARNPRNAYIVRFDAPKVANLKALMPEVYRQQPVLVADVDEKR